MTTSPLRSPACAAGEFACTSVTVAPSPPTTSCMLTPSRPRFTSPKRISWSMTARAITVGTAKPMPTLPPEGPMIAELMPISSPLRLTSAPPELPGLIGASVWMKCS